ncbi:DUF1294 domain-containing protein [Bhargavaea beijingensis]|uniref:DUF1294 domain-containing protein n=1 Tax=Bhargavaea beijingensis TaxID=426756 RepID=A0A1G7ECS1_9BACL|nr:DUF1294 domain-containing protein [Bhargavaea beijingensis]MCW1928485.1 DUF1294 domain-containing protein [Bhargavaea beijingensis]RSK25405.1 DUF1294 domain-containing protein [Bhargavaea beijingensis]SDE61504.1 Uncharacterized membrane protein YsdA, DUF1294 family [Bhargavaea beijingensis]
MESVLIGWILILSAYGFIMMGYDKRQAKNGGWRVPERTLWMIAILGGGPGAYAGMQTFRHKTKHTAFRVGFLVLAIADLAAIVYLAGNLQLG